MDRRNTLTTCHKVSRCRDQKCRSASLTASKRLVYEDRVQVPRLYIQWPTVGFKHDDDYALSVMSSILSGSRTARLTKALVYDSQVSFAGVCVSKTRPKMLVCFKSQLCRDPSTRLPNSKLQSIK